MQNLMIFSIIPGPIDLRIPIREYLILIKYRLAISIVYSFTGQKCSGIITRILGMACHALHKLPQLSANREISFTGRNYRPGGSDEHDTVYRDTDRFDSLGGIYRHEGR